MAASDPARETLFALKEYETAWLDVSAELLDQFEKLHSPLIAQIPTEAVGQVPVGRFYDSGEPVDTRPVTIEATMLFPIGDMLSGLADDTLSALYEAGEGVARQKMDFLLATVSAAAEAAGNSVNAGGRPLDWDLILDVAERLEISVRADGTPILPTVVAHPDTVSELVATPMSPEQQSRLNSLLLQAVRRSHAERRTRRISRQR